MLSCQCLQAIVLNRQKGKKPIRRETAARRFGQRLVVLFRSLVCAQLDYSICGHIEDIHLPPLFGILRVEPVAKNVLVGHSVYHQSLFVCYCPTFYPLL